MLDFWSNFWGSVHSRAALFHLAVTARGKMRHREQDAQRKDTTTLYRKTDSMYLISILNTFDLRDLFLFIPHPFPLTELIDFVIFQFDSILSFDDGQFLTRISK